MNDGVAQKLRAMVDDCGPALLASPDRCSALMADDLAAFPLETSVLRTALNDGVPTELMDGRVPLEVQLPRLAERLHRRHGLDPLAALTAVETWAFALRLSVLAGASATTAPVQTDLVETDAPLKSWLVFSSSRWRAAAAVAVIMIARAIAVSLKMQAGPDVQRVGSTMIMAVLIATVLAVTALFFTRRFAKVSIVAMLTLQGLLALAALPAIFSDPAAALISIGLTLNLILILVRLLERLSAIELFAKRQEIPE